MLSTDPSAACCSRSTVVPYPVGGVVWQSGVIVRDQDQIYLNDDARRGDCQQIVRR
jgi:hypothetical protein